MTTTTSERTREDVGKLRDVDMLSAQEEMFTETETVGDWGADLSVHISGCLDALARYVGIEFPDGRLAEIACEATDVLCALVLQEVRARRTRGVEPSGDRPSFCFWMPDRVDDEEECN